MTAAGTWAGIDLSAPRVMGILNVTPDSFSDGGAHAEPEAAIAAGKRMLAAGADVIDVGGESTRPGSPPTPPAIEQARVIPVVHALAEAGACVSIDTRHASTMAAALAAGARIVNDISGLTFDSESRRVVARAGCPVVLMHTRGTPETMNAMAQYGDVVAEVGAELAQRVRDAIAAGIAAERILADPGIGFAKTQEHNLALLRALPTLRRAVGRPLLVGVSRKRFIGRLTGAEVPRERLAGSLAAGLFAVTKGVAMLRVHDVAETLQALHVWQPLAETGCNHSDFALS
jgi:dihydropteroate synthase